ncbi:MAG: dehydrogenase, partial [Candidatus Poribacteria bacterium]|nr:dehydrogenase [Candidatus Poribacteria bacterium]
IKTDQPFVPAGEMRGLDAFIAFGGVYSAETFEGADRLTLVARHGVGYDNFDLQAATEANVMISITPRGIRHSVAEGIIALMFALSKHVVARDRAVRAGEWRDTIRMGVELAGRTLGSIGIGNIGGELFRLLEPFGMRFLAYDPYASIELAESLSVELTDLQSLLSDSDYVCVCCPLTDETRGLIGAREFGLMKSSVFLINTARGPIVDQIALTEALKTKRILGAGIDVFEVEPVEPDDPLLALDNVILTPHAIAMTDECYQNIGRTNCQRVIQVSRGEIPDDIVNKKVLDRQGFHEKLARYRNSFHGSR